MATNAPPARNGSPAAPARRTLPRQPRVKRGPGRPRLEDAARLAARSRILDAARRLFSTHGYECTTTRDIGDRAGVDAALVNYYFKTKEELREIILKEVEDESTARLRPLVEDHSRPAIQRFPDVVDTLVAILANHPEFLPLLTELSIEGVAVPWPDSLGLVRTCLEEVVAESRGTAKPDGATLSAMLLGMVSWPFIFRRTGRRHFGLDIADGATRARYSAQIVKLVLAGIGASTPGAAPARAARAT